ncbi:MAG: hypothetical protein PUK59_03180 [Actinomycetaceae bacterium]|nr:hypothetical protein [Actinomycetaceae bacterium]MDY5855291.1 hypothetical protein [Arcanobacterium sp.]
MLNPWFWTFNGAIFSIWHNLSGALISVIYRWMQEREEAKAAAGE